MKGRKIYPLVDSEGLSMRRAFRREPRTATDQTGFAKDFENLAETLASFLPSPPSSWP